jgi:hypothetical protein
VRSEFHQVGTQQSSAVLSSREGSYHLKQEYQTSPLVLNCHEHIEQDQQPNIQN